MASFIFFQRDRVSDFMQLCPNKRTATLIQTSPFSRPPRDALEEAEGGGEEEVVEEERWGQEVLS